MAPDEVSLKNLRVDDPMHHITPLLDETSSQLGHSHTNKWESSFHFAGWSQRFQKVLSIFQRRAASSNPTEPTQEESIPLIWEDLEATSNVPTIDDGPRFATLEYLSPWFPEANPAHPKAQTWRTWRSKRQTVLISCSFIACLVFLINLVTVVYLKIRWKTIGDFGTIHRGDCSQSHRLNSSLHIIINVLSTILLGASNLCMQLLAAPTRQEIDEAHKNYVWLDIGVPSFRNLAYISKRRSVAVFLLAISSIPLHFLSVWLRNDDWLWTDTNGHRYNSTIIPTVAVNSFAYIAVDKSFLEGGYWNTSETVQTQLSQKSSSSNMTWMLQTWHELDLHSAVELMQIDVRNNSHYTRIENLECILTYNELLGNRSDFIMVSTTPPKSNNSLLAYGMSTSGTWDIGYGLCSGGGQFDCGRLSDMSPKEQMNAIKGWNIGGYKIDYCLSSERSTENLCSVEYSFRIILSSSPSSVKYGPKRWYLLTWDISRVHIQLFEMHPHNLYCKVPFRPRRSSTDQCWWRYMLLLARPRPVDTRARHRLKAADLQQWYNLAETRSTEISIPAATMATCGDLEEMDALYWLVSCIFERVTEKRLTLQDPLRLSSPDRFSWVPVLQDSRTGNTRPTSTLWSKWASARFSRNHSSASSRPAYASGV